MDLNMQGLLENIPVAAMLLIMHAPLAIGTAALLLACVGVAAWRRNWCDTRRLRWGALAFIVATPLAAALVFLILGGSPADMGYWLDWLFWAAIAAGAGLYVAVVVYCVAPSAVRRVQT